MLLDTDMRLLPCIFLQLAAAPVHVLPFCQFSRFHYFTYCVSEMISFKAWQSAWRPKQSSFTKHACIWAHAQSFWSKTGGKKTPKFDFRVSLQEPLASLVNQTLFCHVSQPACLPSWLDGYLQRGPMRDNRRKENSHMHMQISNTCRWL